MAKNCENPYFGQKSYGRKYENFCCGRTDGETEGWSQIQRTKSVGPKTRMRLNESIPRDSEAKKRVVK